MCQKKILKNTVDLANFIKDALDKDMDNNDSLSYPECIQSMTGDLKNANLSI